MEPVFFLIHAFGMIIPTDELILFRGVGFNHQPVMVKIFVAPAAHLEAKKKPAVPRIPDINGWDLGETEVAPAVIETSNQISCWMIPGSILP